MTDYVECGLAGKTFLVADPKKYPYGDYQFEDELDIKGAYWSDIKPGEMILDIGASWGGYTLPALAHGARVLAYEPSDVENGVLMGSLERNGWGADRVIVEKSVLYDGSPIPQWFKDVVYKNFQIPLEIKTVRLDDELATKRGFTGGRVDRVKMDVEGAEEAILWGAEGMIREMHPLMVIEDHTTNQFPGLSNIGDRCEAILRGYGYEKVERLNPPRGNPFLIAHPLGTK